MPQRPDAYVWMHRLMVRAVDAVIPVPRVCSIDEVVGRLTPRDAPVVLMASVKHALVHVFNRTLAASLGVAPTPLLARIAAESRKPDGATYWPVGSRLGLHCPDVTGLGPARLARIAGVGFIRCAFSPSLL